MPKRYDNNRILLFGDTHYPYAVKGWYDFLEGINTYYKPDRVICMGDLLDIYSVSSYPKDMDHPDSWTEEIKQARKDIAKLSSLFPVMDVLDSNHDCFDDQTEILVKGCGFIPFNSLEEGMEVGTFNKETSEIEYQQPTRIIRDPFNGSMVKIRGRVSVDLKVTNNHRIWCSKQDRKHFKMFTAHNLLSAPGNRVFFKDCGVNNKPDYPNLSDDMIRLVGWYLTDASSRGRQILFHQRVSNAHKITDLLSALEIPYKSYEKDCSHITEICGRVLKKVPENQMVFTIDSCHLDYWVPNRYTLPPWVYELSQRQVDLLVEVLIEADGSICHDTREARVLYGTYDFLNQIQTWLIHTGFRANLVKYRIKDWRLNITKRIESCIDTFPNSISSEEYHGMIYCAEVPNDTLVVRRNGRVSITGNSRVYKRSTLNGIPREFIVPYKQVIGAPETWKFHNDLRITVDQDRSNWHFAHTISGGAASASKQLGVSVAVGHSHTKFGATGFNNGKHNLWGVDAGCLISDKGSPFSYNKNQIGRPIRGAVMIIGGLPYLEPFK